MKMKLAASLLFLSPVLTAQEQPRALEPLPDIPTLLRDVQAHEKALQKIKKDYIFKEETTDAELDKDDQIRKTTTELREIFFIGNHEIVRMLRKNGHDLTPEEAAKEQEKVEKEIARAKKKEEKSEENKDTVTLETLLRICNFTSPRREPHDGRDVLVFDFSGNPDAKTNGLAQTAVKKLAGTLWVDEQYRAVVRAEVHFADSLKIGGGLLATVQKGSWLVFEQGLVNNEVWLPTMQEASLTGRVLLLKGFREHQTSRFSDYRKFRSKTSITLPEPEPAEQK